MTEELNFKAICDLAINVCDVSKDTLLSKTRKRKVQAVRASVAYIARTEEDIHRIIQLIDENKLYGFESLNDFIHITDMEIFKKLSKK